MSNLQAPPDLRARIHDDLAPVRPLASPVRRAAAIVPVALVLLVGSALALGLRRDAPAIGLALTWGASILQMALGLAIGVAALREAVPGRALPTRMLAMLGLAGLTTVLAITWLTWSASPTRIAPRAVVWVWQVCVGATIVTAAAPLAVSGYLAARAFALRPAVTGALCGLGAGLMADAGWRLFCHFSDPTHVLSAHALGVVAVTAAGGALGRLFGHRPR